MSRPYEPGGHGFESCRARQKHQGLAFIAGPFHLAAVRTKGELWPPLFCCGLHGCTIASPAAMTASVDVHSNRMHYRSLRSSAITARTHCGSTRTLFRGGGRAPHSIRATAAPFSSTRMGPGSARLRHVLLDASSLLVGLNQSPVSLSPSSCSVALGARTQPIAALMRAATRQSTCRKERQ